jgi:hypothetical protein
VRKIPYKRKVPCGTFNKFPVSTSTNREGIFLRDLTYTLEYFYVMFIIIVARFFVNDLISYLWKILTLFLPIIMDLFSFSYLVGTLVVCDL